MAGGRTPCPHCMAKITVPNNTSASKRRGIGKTQFRMDTRKVPSSSSSLTIVLLVILAIFLSVMILLEVFSDRKSSSPPSASEQVNNENLEYTRTYTSETAGARTPHASSGKRSPEERWKEALAFAESNPNDYRGITDVFRKLKKELAGSEYEKMAELKIKELANLQMQAETDSEDLQTNTADNDDFMERIAAAKSQTDSNVSENKIDNFMDSLVPILVKKDYAGVLLMIDEKMKDPAFSLLALSLEKIRKDLEPLANMDKLSEKEKLGRTVEMRTESRNILIGFYYLRKKDYIKSEDSFKKAPAIISGALVRYVARIKKATADIEIKNELMKRIKKVEMKGRDFTEEDLKAELAAGGFSSEKTEEFWNVFASHRAEKELAKLLSGLGIKTVTSSKIKGVFSQKKLSVGEIEEIRSAVAAYRNNFGNTEFAKGKNQFLDNLLSEAEKSFSLQFSKILKIPGVKMELVSVPPGVFRMGKADSKRIVKLTRPFWIGKYEVTQEQFEKIMRKNPSTYKNPAAPVEKVTWNDAVEFCRKLTEIERKRKDSGIQDDYEYRLPTEVEWEFCCRAGTESSFSFGESAEELYLNGNYCDSSNKDKLKCADLAHDDGCDKTSAVGKYRPNLWGIYDMHGNVREWCYDWYGDIKDAECENPTGISSGASKVNRGGAWDESSEKCTSFHRGFDSPESSFDDLGFRIVLAPSLPANNTGKDIVAKK